MLWLLLFISLHGSAWSQRCSLNCSALQDCAVVDLEDLDDTYTVSFASCKSSNISWFCCRDSSCTANCASGRCNNFNEVTIQTPPDTEFVNIQVHDGSLKGNLGSSEELVCTKNTGGNCGGLNTCNVTLELPPGCVNGNMLMNTKNHGTLAVKDITTGMSVRGKRNGVEDWCAVTSNSALGRGRLVGDFTSNHVVMQHDALQESGNSGLAREGDLYNLATDCEFTTNSNGVSFTPFSSDSSQWHSRLSISQYYTFFQALRALSTHLPFDIFDVSQYKGNFKKQADRVCNKLVDCLFEDRNCALLNKAFDELVNNNLNVEAKKAVKKVFKNGAAIAHTAKTHRLR